MSTLEDLSIPYTHHLDQDGQLTSNAPPAIATDFETLIAMYRIMTLTRVFDNKAIALQRTGKMGTYASTYGQEAIGTAIGNVLQADDVFVPFYRDYATLLQRSVSLHEIFTYWGGDERGSCYRDNKHDLPMAVPIASQCLHAAGAAFAFKYRQQNRVALVTCGDGATSQGDFYEATNLAGAWQLPVVFVVNNNQWAISVPRNAQTRAKTLAQKAIAAGFEGIQVDGNDIIALHQVIADAVEHARQGNGPLLIEAITYRLCDHTTADDASRYRPDDEVQQAIAKEPIKRLRQYLIANQQWDDNKEQQLLAQCKQQVDDAVATYANLQPQSIDSIFDFHYANTPESLTQQRQQALENVDA